MRGWIQAAAIALLVTSIPAAAKLGKPADVAAAVAATGARTPANIELDAGRKPAELLNFLGLREGMRVIDMFGGNLYWSEIMAPAVGPTGQVIIWNPAQFTNAKRLAAFAAFNAKTPNVWFISSPFEAPDLSPGRYDLMLMNLDYHDVYWQSAERKIPRMEPDVWLKTLYGAMKPGGTVGIVDHVGPAGDTRAVVEKLHRIDPKVVLADFKRAGFVLTGTSKLLANPADDHSLLVFDPAIRGKTDRFIYRFKRPR
ncbi:MAG TPA: methyltransferase, partial [Sphingomicrobium sp.]|nr:methyltransferase [Sphingomicrobium sp.]